MINTILSIDIGTTFLKAGLISDNGKVVSVYAQKLEKPNDRYVALQWLVAFDVCIKNIQKELEPNVKICGISVSGNGPTLVSQDGCTLRWNENLPKNIQKINNKYDGILKKSLFLPRILAFKSQFKENYEKSKYLFSGPEFFIYILTNRAVTILPEIRYKNAYWHRSHLKHFAISTKKIPRYVLISKKCGLLKSELCKKYNLPTKIPVFAGGPDFVVALIGTNTLSVGKICDRSGSSEGFNFCIGKPVYTQNTRTLPSVIPNLWNISIINQISSSLSLDERLKMVKNSLCELRKVAMENGITFPNSMTVTGGQAKDAAFMKKKADYINMQLEVTECLDSELLGDACAGFVGLGKYKNLIQAAENIVKCEVFK